MSSDTRPQDPADPGFAEECARQCAAVAANPDHDLDTWLDALNHELAEGI